ncbi:MAG TPA: TetR/AcrR family transcriptional regulator [Steroidobacteraceae bacterium]|nr:TetR/AcrR family transcriptional regulator [Steroidobacteraceae bacterium]
MTARTSRGSRRTESRRPRTGTRDRILRESIALFNRQGVQHVTVEDIASSMGISTGNLTYHFRLKRDLLHAVFDRMQERLRVVLKPSLPAPSREGGEYLVVILQTFWEFRFFFNGLMFLLARDRLLREKYLAFQEWAITALEQGIRDMIAGGGFRQVQPPNSPRLLAENVWGQWLHWLLMQQLSGPAVRVPAGQAMYRSALHLWSLLHPYFTKEYADGLLPVYESMLLTPARRRRSRGAAAGDAPGRARRRASAEDDRA